MFSAMGMNGFICCWYRLHNGFWKLLTGPKERPYLSQNKQTKIYQQPKKIKFTSPRQCKISPLPPFSDLFHKYLMSNLHIVNFVTEAL